MMTLFTNTTLIELVWLLLAFLLSAVIGFERQRKLKSAGLRTHTLVGLGSAVFTLISAYGFAGVVTSDAVLDPSRIAAQVVSGIGFLGAGVIFVQKGTVNGLTTAASIWVTAAIGMACGAGMPVIAIAATTLHLAAVGILTFVGRRIRPDVHEPTVAIRYRRGFGVLRRVLHASAIAGAASLIEEVPLPEKPRQREILVRLGGSAPRVDELSEAFAAIDGVITVRQVRDVDDFAPAP